VNYLAIKLVLKFVLVIKRTADNEYLNLLEKILQEGTSRGDRTGTGTWSIFDHHLEIDMDQGFPLLTTKKMFTKGIIHELLWFLNGDTNIKYLVDNGVHIWNSDAYKKYVQRTTESHETLHKSPTLDVQPLDLLSMDEFIEKIKTDDYFAKLFGDLGPIYGAQWRNWVKITQSGGPLGAGGTIHFEYIDQIQQAMDKLINNPEDRRIIVSAWNVGEIDKMTLPPCHWAFELYVEDIDLAHKWAWLRDNQLEKCNELFTCGDDVRLTHGEISTHFPECPKQMLSLKWHQRSVDTFLGLPFNIASYGILLHMFAQQANMYPNKLIGDLSNVHIYKNHVDQCKIQLEREPLTYPKLVLNKAKDIFSYSYEDIKIIGYEYRPPIKGEISV
jgi:thymidylate synthase